MSSLMLGPIVGHTDHTSTTIWIQVHDDHVTAAVWPRHLGSDSGSRRHAIAAKYQEHWSREPIRSILANTPCYMMWDDHEIRNGWGSYAPDSPALTAQYPRGANIAAQ